MLLLTGTAAAAEMTAQEIMDTHIGKCMTYAGPTTGTQCYQTDGVTTYQDATYGTGSGQWSFQENELCVKYTGEPIDCGPITRVSENTYSDGTYTWTIN
mgnify:CR=1 FL=1